MANPNPRIVYTLPKQNRPVMPAYVWTETINGEDHGNFWWIEPEIGTNLFKVHNCLVSFEEDSIHSEDNGSINRFKALFANEQTKSENILPDVQWSVATQVMFCDIIENNFRIAQVAYKTRSRHLLESLFKGLSAGKSMNSIGFLMKAIKSGYDALGFYSKTYSLLRFHGFGLNDLISYVRTHREGYAPKVPRDIFADVFTKILAPQPSPKHDRKLTRCAFNVPHDFTGIPKLYLDIIKSSMKHWADKGMIMPMKGSSLSETTRWDRILKDPKEPMIVREYAFRGEGRPPLVIRQCGGLHPNWIRNYQSKRGKELLDRAMREYKFEQLKLVPAKSKQAQVESIVAMPHFDPWLHQHNYDSISVFVSVTRNPRTALNFINSYSNKNGYIYVMRALGAIDQEATFQKTQYKEWELSLPGGLDWDDIIGYLQIKNGKPVPYCCVQMDNKWRRDDEVTAQNMAIETLMHLEELPEVGAILE